MSLEAAGDSLLRPGEVDLADPAAALFLEAVEGSPLRPGEADLAGREAALSPEVEEGDTAGTSGGDMTSSPYPAATCSGTV